MKQFLRDNRRILLCTLLSLVAGILIGISIGLSMTPYVGKTAEVNMISTIAVGPGTDLRMHLTFTDCAHSADLILDGDAHMGLTEQELLERYPGASVERFTLDRALLNKRIDGACEKHVRIKRGSDGVYMIEQADYETMRMETLHSVSLNEEILDEAVLSELSNGVLLNSMAEVNAYLESIES